MNDLMVFGVKKPHFLVSADGMDVQLVMGDGRQFQMSSEFYKALRETDEELFKSGWPRVLELEHKLSEYKQALFPFAAAARSVLPMEGPLRDHFGRMGRYAKVASALCGMASQGVAWTAWARAASMLNK